MKKLFAILTVALLLLTLGLPALAAETEAVTEPSTEITTEITSAADESETDDGPKTSFGFYPETLTETLPIMGMGMLGIFLVIGTIILVVLVLSAISKKFDKDEE